MLANPKPSKLAKKKKKKSHSEKFGKYDIIWVTILNRDRSIGPCMVT